MHRTGMRYHLSPAVGSSSRVSGERILFEGMEDKSLRNVRFELDLPSEEAVNR